MTDMFAVIARLERLEKKVDKEKNLMEKRMEKKFKEEKEDLVQKFKEEKEDLKLGFEKEMTILREENELLSLRVSALEEIHPELEDVLHVGQACLILRKALVHFLAKKGVTVSND